MVCMISLELLRSFRFLGYAVFDLVVSFVGFGLLAPLLSRLFLKIKISVPKWNWLYLVLPIGILTHLVFGRMTPMTRQFFDLSGYYVLKVLILGLLILGLRGVRIVGKKRLKT